MRKQLFNRLSIRIGRGYQATGIVGCLLFLSQCPPTPPPPPVSATFGEFQPKTGRGGRAVAVSIFPLDPLVAIGAGESGGLFQTKDGGQTWSHLDSFPPFRMQDVAFAPASTNSNAVVATAGADSNPDPQANLGGVWTSNDTGASWTHLVPPSSCPAGPMNGFGIAFLPPSTVLVATGCGLLANTSVGGANWAQPSHWTRIYPSELTSVSAQSFANGTSVIDVCLLGGGQDRSLNGGNTWRGAVSLAGGPDCQSTHSIANSPLDSNVVLATSGSTVVESDDGGSTWPIDLKAGSTSNRVKFVVTHLSADQNPAHFDLYYSGQLATCSNTPQAGTGQRCPTNTGTSWTSIPNIPGTNLNHDINGIAISPKSDNCAVYEVSDFGVMRKGIAVPGNACGTVGTWTLPGNSESGFGALQIYQVAGQVQYPVTGGGINISGYTTLFFGTMDNLEWANHDAAVPGWQAFGVEGSFLQVLNDTTLAAQPADLELNFVDFGGGGIGDFKNVPNIAAGSWSNMQPWTAATPPGNGSPAFIVAAHTYVEWSGTTLLLTQDSGQSWTPVGTLPAGETTFNGIQVADTGQGPAIYEMVADASGNQGIALLVHFLPPPATPRAFEIQTMNGTNDRGNPSGLKAIWGTCFGQGAWYCAPVFAANPKDYRVLYAVDSAQKFVAVSRDAGETWQEDFGLTNLVTAGGVPFTDSIGNSQIHLFAFDPANPSHILVGTDQAGLFASANGGLTWSAVPNTAQARAISSIFFDARTQNIYVATYGRGLWKLNIDWTTVH